MKPGPATLRWAAALFGAALIVAFIILVFLIGEWIATSGAEQRCLDAGRQWDNDTGRCLS